MSASRLLNDSDNGCSIGLAKLTLVFPLYDMGDIIWPLAFEVQLSMISSDRPYYIAFMRMNELLFHVGKG